MSNKEAFSIIIPTYNEKENLVTLIPRLKKIYPDSYIFIVDDNSRDDTADFMEKISRQYRGIHFISRNGKLGRGSAVISGLKKALVEAKTEYYLEIDADFSHDPDEIHRLLDRKNPSLW